MVSSLQLQTTERNVSHHLKPMNFPYIHVSTSRRRHSLFILPSQRRINELMIMILQGPLTSVGTEMKQYMNPVQHNARKSGTNSRELQVLHYGIIVDWVTSANAVITHNPIKVQNFRSTGNNVMMALETTNIG